MDLQGWTLLSCLTPTQRCGVRTAQSTRGCRCPVQLGAEGVIPLENCKFCLSGLFESQIPQIIMPQRTAGMWLLRDNHSLGLSASNSSEVWFPTKAHAPLNSFLLLLTFLNVWQRVTCLSELEKRCNCLFQTTLWLQKKWELLWYGVVFHCSNKANYSTSSFSLIFPPVSLLLQLSVTVISMKVGGLILCPELLLEFVVTSAVHG